MSCIFCDNNPHLGIDFFRRLNKYLSRNFTVHGEPVEPFAQNTSTSSVRTDDIYSLYLKVLENIFAAY